MFCPHCHSLNPCLFVTWKIEVRFNMVVAFFYIHSINHFKSNNLQFWKWLASNHAEKSFSKFWYASVIKHLALFISAYRRALVPGAVAIIMSTVAGLCGLNGTACWDAAVMPHIKLIIWSSAYFLCTKSKPASNEHANLHVQNKWTISLISMIDQLLH